MSIGIIGLCRLRLLQGLLCLNGYEMSALRSAYDAASIAEACNQADCQRIPLLDVYSPGGSSAVVLEVNPCDCLTIIELAESINFAGDLALIYNSPQPNLVSDPLFGRDGLQLSLFGRPRQSVSLFPGLSMLPPSRAVKLSVFPTAASTASALGWSSHAELVSPAESLCVPLLVIDDKWQQSADLAIRTHVRTAPGGCRMVVCGGLKVGKSSFARYLVNRFLSSQLRSDAVAYIDLDCGQTEFSAPGMFTLSVLRGPLLGPPYTHPNCGVVASVFTGSITVGNIRAMADSVRYLFSLYLRDHVGLPLIVNTMGWVQGNGLRLLSEAVAAVSPDVLFAFPDTTAAAAPGDAFSAPPEQLPAGCSLGLSAEFDYLSVLTPLLEPHSESPKTAAAPRVVVRLPSSCPPKREVSSGKRRRDPVLRTEGDVTKGCVSSLSASKMRYLSWAAYLVSSSDNSSAAGSEMFAIERLRLRRELTFSFSAARLYHWVLTDDPSDARDSYTNALRCVHESRFGEVLIRGDVVAIYDNAALISSDYRLTQLTCAALGIVRSVDCMSKQFVLQLPYSYNRGDSSELIGIVKSIRRDTDLASALPLPEELR